MTKNEFIKGIKYMVNTYNTDFSEEKTNIWWEMFENDNYETYRQAIKRLVTKEEFLPSIAKIKQEMSKIENPNLVLDAEEEWKEVILAIRQYGVYQQDYLLNSLKPFIRDIVEKMGVYNLCTTDKIEYKKREFKELFSLYQEKDGKINSMKENTRLETEKKRLNTLEEYNYLDYEE